MRNSSTILRTFLLAAALLLLFNANSFADLGDGILLGKTFLSPYLEGTVTRDSNVIQWKEPESDTLFAAKLGTGFARPGGTVSFSGDLWIQMLRYRDHPERDDNRIGESLVVDAQISETFRFSIGQSYATSTEEKDYLTDLLTTIREFGGTISMGKQLTEDTRISASYGRSYADYEIDALYDWHRDNGALTLDHRLTDKTTAFLSSRVSLQYSQGSGNATIFSESAGLRTELTEKTSGSASLGWEHQEADTVVSIPSSDGSLTWAATETANVGLKWGVSIRPAIEYEDNYIVCSLAELRTGIELTDTFRVDTGVGYHQNRYQNEVTTRWGEAGRLVEDVTVLSMGFAYAAPLKWLSIFTRGEWIDKAATLDIREYERYRITVGARISY